MQRGGEATVLRRRLLRRLAYLRRNRCSVLLAMLCMIILLTPLLTASVTGALLLSFTTFAVLVLAVWALRAQRMMFWTVGLLALVTLQALVADRLGEHWLRPVVLAAMALLLAAVTIALLRYVLDLRPITTDKVFGAVAAYVLIAFTFASLFGLLQLFQPNAFNASAVNEPDGLLDWSDMMYFSFTVLTSTGFGEITPVTHMARSLIVIEQVLGVMYVAFLIARLANLYGRSQRTD
jgi:Ion channel